jgi:serine/threonine protein kinase
MAAGLRLTGQTDPVEPVTLAGVPVEPALTVHRGASISMVSPCPHPTIRRPSRGQAPVRSRAAGGPVGELLAGRYRIAELAGRGMTGRVWRARDELLARDVAVKQLSCRQPERMTEARIAARVRHPGVAAVHDVVEHRGSSWMVMDYYPGGTLAALLRHGRRLPPPLTAALGLQLAAALEAVHAAGIVHCDVKPANLLLGGDGRLVLVDFGIAEGSEVGPVDPGRAEGFVVGSPPYLAPELVRGEPAGPAADLWSLGATLYVAVEGRPAFGGDGAAETLAAVLNDPPPAPCRAGPLGPLLARLLAKDPADRPSHRAIRDALAELSAGAPVITAGSHPADRAGADADPTRYLPASQDAPG